MTIPTLPQKDDPARQAQRQQRLARAREDYRYLQVETGVRGEPALPMIDELPFAELFSVEYLTRVTKAGLELVGNRLLVELQGLLPESPRLRDLDTRRLKAVTPTTYLGPMEDLAHRLAALPPLPARSLKQYDQLSPLLQRLPIVDVFQQDTVFAHQRTAGPNPLVLQRVDEVPSHLAITEAHFQRALGEGDSLAAARAEGRLFLADYAVLEGLPPGTTPDGRRKYIRAPMALFCWREPPAAGLVPVAIQLGQSRDAPVFTPADGTAWQVAKLFVQVADGNVHETISHLGRTHLLVEPFVLATARQLDRTHPVAVLLQPHFRFTLGINHAARRILIAPGGGVDQLLAGTLEGSLSLASTARAAPFRDGALPRELAQRGLADTSVLPDYPYREDALPLWKAIQDFVTQYLRLYYAGDADVVGDFELQGWVRELQSGDGGHVQGLTASGGIETVADLEAVLTQLLFTAGPQHAAVNFTQFPLMGYVPNQPLAAYAPPPADASPLPHEALLRWLPPLDQAFQQESLLYLLSSLRLDELGRYRFTDPRAIEAATTFRRRLKELDADIDERNRTRAMPYPYLKPSRIPNSINI
ncbi:lipoxygenase family protein [Archangium sp.]|uniref:lipoxygenase family protein n=1 Tax=Archangium sp. TaxID=1872627 RepID=UPI002D251372|nr:lipoxygenase family protein [Archangium sp.]HYO59322.1 lipoxygenase family protein [Archangium sp.]